ncbi:MAG: prephenate dehydrogenase/arogenate dehydrogenase family protein [Nitrososphaeria archaeon]|nr:prephenate dehydrogenase/arogenate dehydrogenase family protein [Nitrososphaeria archaeon]
MNIAIIGAGKMGRWFIRFFLNEGYKVEVIEKDERKFSMLKDEFGVNPTKDYSILKNICKILVAVPLDNFEDTIKSISPYISREHVILDICSLKEKPVNIMHKYIKFGITLGMHPLFGPGAKSISGQNIVLTPVRYKEKRFAEEFKKWLEKKGANVYIMSPKKHDKLMSIVLYLPHIIGLLVCDTLAEYEFYSEAKKISGTSFKLLITLAESVALEDPEFYATLHTSIPDNEEIGSALLKKLAQWVEIVRNKDKKEFVKRMMDIKSKIEKISPEYTKSYDSMYDMLEDMRR